MRQDIFVYSSNETNLFKQKRLQRLSKSFIKIGLIFGSRFRMQPTPQKCALNIFYIKIIKNTFFGKQLLTTEPILKKFSINMYFGVKFRYMLAKLKLFVLEIYWRVDVKIGYKCKVQCKYAMNRVYLLHLYYIQQWTLGPNVLYAHKHIMATYRSPHPSDLVYVFNCSSYSKYLRIHYV